MQTEISSIDLIVGVADLHVNDTMGLMPPVFKREFDLEVRAGRAHLAIYSAWKDFWQLITDKRRALEGQIVEELLQTNRWMTKNKAIHAAQDLLHVRKFVNGDLCDQNAHEKTQLISPVKADIKRALVTVAQPMLDVPGDNFIIRGTAAHTGSNGELEEWFAEDIGAVPCNYEDSYSWWLLKARWAGVKFDITHHPPTGTKMDSKKNQSVARAAERVANAYMRKRMEADKPDFAIFGHLHYCGAGQELGVRARYLPPWKLIGAHGHRIGVMLAEPVGGWWAVCRDGKVIEEPEDNGSGPFELWEPPRIERWEQDN